MPETPELKDSIRHVWEKRDDESGIAFDAFKTFRNLGVTRTVANAYRSKTGKAKAKKAAGAWFKWAKAFAWYERAEAFDRHVAAIEARAEEAAFANTRREWIARRSEIQNSAWNLAGLLEAKAKEILALPLTRTTETEEKSEDGKTIRVVRITEPVRVGVGDAIRAAETSDKLKRLAANMATERIVTKSQAAEAAETLEDARAAFREARELYGETEPVEVTARNIAAAYALDVQQILEGYDETQPLASHAEQ